MTRPQTAAQDGWLRSLDALVATPPEHREDPVGWEEALRLLRCDEQTLETLVERGLPVNRQGDDCSFERADLYNLALWSRSNRSVPEFSAVFVRRLGREGIAAWTRPLLWDVRIELRCPLGADCPGGTWTMARPRAPLARGGEMSWHVAGEPVARVGGMVSPPSSRMAVFEGSLTTSGGQYAVVSPAIRAAYSRVIEDHRFHVLTRSWKSDLDAVRGAAVVDCDAAASLLATACRDAGYDARIDTGFLLGIVGFSEHSWVLVRDDDGAWKPLEPILPLLAKVGWHDDAATDAFARFCCGSTLNRVLACDLLPDGELAGHCCDGMLRHPDVTIRAHVTAGMHTP